LLVTPHAVALHTWHVRLMLESQVVAGHLGAGPDMRLTVTARARALVMGLFVAAQAVGLGRQMERPFVPGETDLPVTLPAVDTFEHMSPVLEGSLWLGLDAQDAGARGEQEGQEQDEECPRRQRDTSKVRPTRARATVSRRSSGLAEASTAPE